MNSEQSNRQRIVARAKKYGDEKVWPGVKSGTPDAALASYDLFTYALVLCEANEDLDRLDRIFEVAKKMQDLDPESGTYGNFWWNWSHQEVKDLNAVEFCMRGATVLWMRHKALLSESARELLRYMMGEAVKACWTRWVREMYTNIALMNAMNLMLLGRIQERPETTAVGQERFERFCLYTWEWGIHEYCSPTYTGIDLYCLGLIQRFCTEEPVAEQSDALLRLFWSDVGLNRLPGSGRLGGTASRELGSFGLKTPFTSLDTMMWLVGWGPGTDEIHMNVIYSLLAVEKMPEVLRHFLNDRSVEQHNCPREVKQGWGQALYQVDRSKVQYKVERAWTSCTNYICKDVALSTSSAGYDYPDFRDLPLVVDFPEGGRGYLVANPLGDLFNYAHTSPLLWAAVQREGEALGLVVYDFQEDFNNLETHFILPASDEIWIGDRRIEPDREEMVWMKAGEALVCRKGTAAVGIRFVWARTVKNGVAPVLFCANGVATPGSARVSVQHHFLWGVEGRDGPWATPGTACFVRVGSNLEDDAAFFAWRESFGQAPVQVDEEFISIWVGHREMLGKLKVQTGNPSTRLEMGVFWAGNQLDLSRLEPRPPLSLLEVNGKQVGRPMLKNLELVQRYEAALSQTTLVPIEEDKSAYWQASDGRVWAPMEVRPHAFSQDGDFVWLPSPAYNPAGNGRNVDSVGSDVGSATWRLRVQKAGTYYLWGHVADNTFLMGPWGVRKGNIAFLVRVFQDSASPLYLSEWTPIDVMRWAWSPVILSEMVGPAHYESGLVPTALDLPEGEIKLQVWALEAEIGIDRWFLTTDAGIHPMERIEPAKPVQGDNG